MSKYILSDDVYHAYGLRFCGFHIIPVSLDLNNFTFRNGDVVLIKLKSMRLLKRKIDIITRTSGVTILVEIKRGIDFPVVVEKNLLFTPPLSIPDLVGIILSINAGLTDKYIHSEKIQPIDAHIVELLTLEFSCNAVATILDLPKIKIYKRKDLVFKKLKLSPLVNMATALKISNVICNKMDKKSVPKVST